MFQLFDKNNYVNRHFDKYIFNTEGHLFPVEVRFREKPWSLINDVPTLPLSSYNVSEPLVSKYRIYILTLKLSVKFSKFQTVFGVL